ncbi:hypothetical protein MXMO3_01660 [Maritalea myrionectae]|uniref:Uncharacterized protein n=1 Tax=Maritalea myrionectae TaxID=454601 RepID=A0A2R4ME68_9HYPH|nr:hypothetical protein [Maritalea myrionectae]AVX04186.1 hypothetical protein MXMO3_01660 [Maritalea myrionectae]
MTKPKEKELTQTQIDEGRSLLHDFKNVLDDDFEECAENIAQALAAAREEGRRDMRDECAELAKDVAIMHEQNGLTHPSNSPGRGRCFARSRCALDISGDISDLPTNAPEGESDEPADLADCENWFRLSPRESETRTCATDDCLNPPSYRFEASGIGSDYCMNCASTIQKQALKSLPTKER